MRRTICPPMWVQLIVTTALLYATGCGDGATETVADVLQQDQQGSPTDAAHTDTDRVDTTAADLPEPDLTSPSIDGTTRTDTWPDDEVLSGGCALFAPAVRYPAGVGPVAVAAADSNRDGVSDLLVANAGDDMATLSLGNGDGTFQDARAFPVIGSANAVLMVDLEGDDAVDLVVAGGRGAVDDNLLVWPTATSRVTTVHGSSEPTFFMGQFEHAVAGRPVSVAAADLDGDGRPDLATASGSLGGRVDVLLAQAGGGFAPAYSFADDAAAVVALELTGDTHNDLAVVRDNAPTLAILPGRGDGTFGAAVIAELGAPSTALAAGDLDGDGRFDLATANMDGSVDVFFVGAEGGLEATQRLTVGGTLSGLTIADVDGDGLRDLAITSPFDNTLYVVLHNAPRGFEAAQALPLPGGPMSVAAADLNGDGLSDLAVALSTEGAVAVLLATGICSPSGAPAPVQAPPPVPAGPSAPLSELRCANLDDHALSFALPGELASFVVGDVNNDGQGDLVTLVGNTLAVSLGTGNGTFQAPSSIVAPAELERVLLGHTDDDTYLDIIATRKLSPDLTVFPSDGNGAFGAGISSTVLPATTAFGPVVVADVNGDAWADVVGLTGSNQESVVLGVGAGTFAAAVSFHAGDSPSLLAVGDLNGDGHTDIAAPGYDKDVAVLLGDGTGAFTGAGEFATHIKPVGVSSADLNGDGYTDVLVALNKGVVEVLLGGASPALAPPVAYTVGPNPSAIAVADFNGDTRLDVVVATLEGSLTLLAGRGDGTFDTTTTYAVGLYAERLTTSDLNGDGQADLVFVDEPAARLNVLLGRRRCQ